MIKRDRDLKISTLIFFLMIETANFKDKTALTPQSSSSKVYCSELAKY